MKLESKHLKVLSSSLMLGSLLACSQVPKNPEVTDDRKKAAFGIKFSPQPVCFQKPLANGALCGLKMEVVFPYLAASKAGLQSGDLWLGLNQEIFGQLKEADVPRLTERLGKLSLGDRVQFSILRTSSSAVYQINKGNIYSLQTGEIPPLGKLDQPEVQEITGQWKKTTELLKIDFKVEGRTWHYGNQAPVFLKNWPAVPAEINLQREVQKVITSSQKKNEITEDLLDLEKRFVDLDLLVDQRRLPIVAYLQKNPWRIQDVQNLTSQTASDCKQIWDKCISNLMLTAGISLEPYAKIQIPEISTPAAYLKLAEKIFRQSQELLQSAFRRLTAEEKEYLHAHLLPVTEKLIEAIYLHEDGDKNRLQRDLRLMELMQKIDLSALAASLLPYQSLFDPVVLEKLRHHPDASKDFVSVLKTELGDFVIGGTAANNYATRADSKTLFILDLGGDDFYPDVSANIIDLSGNDIYESARPWTLNSGFLRTRVLIDFEGDDTYQCADGCLASSLMGASLFLDIRGNDSYTSRYYSIGSSWTGFSLFSDLSGSDTYHSAMISQGVGIAGGVGVLLDHAGDDSYFSKGANASVYGDAGQFDGWSQGVGLGLRNFVSGGWGLLFDHGGKNHFESGTFSQGGGYYFGLGTLISAGTGDDQYSGARYSRGFSAHNAIGSFLDVGGNDTYRSPSDVGEGIAWDLSLTLFEDRAGNDRYQTCAHCLGAGSQNSFAFFLDRRGNDSYKGNDLPFESKRPNDYHGGKSFGLFWDSGNGVDQYGKFKNNSVRTLDDGQILKDE